MRDVRIILSFRYFALELGCPDVPVVIADVNDAPSMETMCAQTQVIISCVGPVR